MKLLAALMLLVSAPTLPAQTNPYPTYPNGRVAISETTVGNVTISGTWMYLNGIDLHTLRIFLETKNPLTDAYRVTFLLKGERGSAVITSTIVRNKAISYPSGEMYPFPAVQDITDLKSYAQIKNLVVEELQFSVLTSGDVSSTK